MPGLFDFATRLIAGNHVTTLLRGEIKAICCHYLTPRAHEVAYKLLLCVILSIELGDCTQLRV